MTYEHFDYEIMDGIATVTLEGVASPPLESLCDEFLDLMLRLQDDQAVRSILIREGDQAFDLSPDLPHLAQVHGDGDSFESLSPNLDIARKIINIIQEIAKPVVAAARGAVIESGFGFYLAADVRLASSTATFTPPDMIHGLLPDWGLSATLPRLLGPGRTLELIWSHRTIDAEEASRIGLVDRVIQDQEWDDELSSFMSRLSNLPQPAVHLTKLAAQQAHQLDMTSMLAYEYEAQQRCWQSQDTSESMAAYLAGREPEFTSRFNEAEE